MKQITSQHKHFLTVLIGLSQMYAWATTYYLPATLLKIVPKETGYSSLIIVGGFSWALLIGGLFAPAIGKWIEKQGGQRPLTVGNLLMGIGLIVLSYTHHWLVWYSGWSIIGLGMALGLFNASFAMLGRLFAQEAKKIIIRVTLISGFATFFWPITTHLIESIGWRNMMLVYALLHLLLWAPLHFKFIPDWVPEHTESSVDTHALNARHLKWLFYLLASYSILRSIVGTAVSVDILALFTGMGIPLLSAAWSASLIGPSQIAGRILELFVGRNFDPMNSSLFWTAMLPLSIFILLSLGNAATPVFAIAYGMSNGVLSITMGILPMILFGSKHYASLLGKLALPTLIAQAATPVLVDPMVQSLPSKITFAVAALLGLASLLCLISLAIMAKRASHTSTVPI